MKMRQDNDMIDHVDAFHVENDTELPWPIRLGAIYDENQIGRWPNLLYKWNLRFHDIKQSWPIGLVADCDENKIGQLRDW